MAITEFEDVQKGFRRPIPETDRAWVEDKIEEAEAILATYRGDLATWAGNDAARLALVKRVVVRMVHRVLQNPDGLYTESDGDYSYSRDGSIASGAIYASPADLRLLGINKRRVGTIRLSLPKDSPRNAHPHATHGRHRVGGFE